MIRRIQSAAECKRLLVQAHRCQDWDLAARLSQAKERLKKRRFCQWPGCGLRINYNAAAPSQHCGLHARLARYSKTLHG